MSPWLERVRRMDAEELRFRAASEIRKLASRTRAAIQAPAWNRDVLPRMLSHHPRIDSAALRSAREAAARRDWIAAHHALAAHFAARISPFPLEPGDVPRIAEIVASRFPDAAADARRRAEAILQGRYELLGHAAVAYGHPPDWHVDPLRGTRAPLTFWASVPYLDPECGDHKLVWELNRHQHWLTLGRAHALTGDQRYYDAFVLQLDDWIRRNPPLQGINWASMLELAFRSLSWLWSIAFFAPAALRGGDDRPWLVDLLVAFDRQLTHVEHNLSRYFSPNTHLTGEALALYVGGCCLPELKASARRAAIGRAVLLQEIDRQVGPDGGHVELSPHYHRYSTDFYLLALDVARASGDPAVARIDEAARRQATYLRVIADERGRIPQLGDDDGGQLFPICRRGPADCSDSLAIAASLLEDPGLRIGTPPEEAFWFCGAAADTPAGRPTRVPSRALAASGYYVSRTRAGDHLVFDAGPHGYLNGGHAHADALSITLSVAGRPLLIDPGTAIYTADPALRDRFRSSAMHNTVVVNGREQSRARGPFHWESAAAARALAWRADDACDYVEGTHDGYAPVAHVRTVLAVHGTGWLIIDHVLGEGEADAEAAWHLAPGWVASRATERTVALELDGARVALASTSAIHIAADVCSPVYGVVESSTTLRATTSALMPLSFATFIAATAEVSQGLRLEPAAITDAPGVPWHGTAFEVAWRDGALIVVSAIESSPVSASGALAPATVWGTRSLRTNGRTAALRMRGSVPVDAFVVNGSTIVAANGASTHQLEDNVPFGHLRLSERLASTVHQATRITRPPEGLRDPKRGRATE